jgi:hypothetical protein
MFWKVMLIQVRLFKFFIRSRMTTFRAVTPCLFARRTSSFFIRARMTFVTTAAASGAKDGGGGWWANDPKKLKKVLSENVVSAVQRQKMPAGWTRRRCGWDCYCEESRSVYFQSVRTINFQCIEYCTICSSKNHATMPALRNITGALWGTNYGAKHVIHKLRFISVVGHE